MSMNCPFCGTAYEGKEMRNNAGKPYWLFRCEEYCAFALSPRAYIKVGQDQSICIRLRNLLKEKSINDKFELCIEQNALCFDDTKGNPFERMILIVADEADDKEYCSHPSCSRYTLEKTLKKYPITITNKIDRALSNIGIHLPKWSAEIMRLL